MSDPNAPSVPELLEGIRQLTPEQLTMLGRIEGHRLQYEEFLVRGLAQIRASLYLRKHRHEWEDALTGLAATQRWEQFSPSTYKGACAALKGAFANDALSLAQSRSLTCSYQIAALLPRDYLRPL